MLAIEKGDVSNEEEEEGLNKGLGLKMFEAPTAFVDSEAIEEEEEDDNELGDDEDVGDGLGSSELSRFRKLYSEHGSKMPCSQLPSWNISLSSPRSIRSLLDVEGSAPMPPAFFWLLRKDLMKLFRFDSLTTFSEKRNRSANSLHSFSQISSGGAASAWPFAAAVAVPEDVGGGDSEEEKLDIDFAAADEDGGAEEGTVTFGLEKSWPLDEGAEQEEINSCDSNNLVSRVGSRFVEKK